jgi:DNA (cytosine-5)-methyltransferase 1
MASLITPEIAWDPKRFPNLETVVGQRMWPTPTAVTRPMEGNVRMYRAKVQAGDMTEAEAEAILGKSVWEAQGKLPTMWPTPMSSTSMAEDIGTVQARLKDGQPYKSRLIEAVAMYPTMSASGMGNTGSRQILQRRVESGEMTETELKGMSAGNGGKLNPTWVEWLMGFPLGWTDLEDSETQSSHKSPNTLDE